MARPKRRTSMLMPLFGARLREWVPNLRWAKNKLGFEYMSDTDFYRIINSKSATPDEVILVESAIISYGKMHNEKGWEDLETNRAQ